MAASASPSAADTIEPFMRMCQERAKTPGRAGRLRRRGRERPRGCSRDGGCSPAAGGVSGPISSSTLMNEQASKSSRWNQSSKRRRSPATGPPGGAAPPCLCFDPTQRPPLFAKLEEREHQMVLGGEMPVQSGLRHTGAVDHLVDSDVANPAAGEQLVGGVRMRWRAPWFGLRDGVDGGMSVSVALTDRSVL